MSETNLRVIRLVTVVVLAPPWSASSFRGAVEETSYIALVRLPISTVQVGKSRTKWGGRQFNGISLPMPRHGSIELCLAIWTLHKAADKRMVRLLYFTYLYLGHM